MKQWVLSAAAARGRAATKGWMSASAVGSGRQPSYHAQKMMGLFGNHHRRFLTSKAARALLGLPTKATKETTPLTLKELRHAYFAAAKRCHPDMKSSKEEEEDEDNTENATTTNSNNSSEQDNNDDNDDKASDFLQITLAYELLQGEITNNQDLLVASISISEEEEFRRACRTVLGIDAETVEECKKSPIFRQWLLGRTDAAHYWKCFFLQHGGLAPKLRPHGGKLAMGEHAKVPSHTTRRKRK